MLAIIKFILLTARRDLLLQGIFIVLLGAAMISQFFGNCALTEQIQMSTSYFAGSSRAIIVGGMIIFIAVHIRRLFETKEIEQMLARPITRSQFILAYFCGFSILGLMLILPCIIIASLFAMTDTGSLLIWSISLSFELFIVIAFAMLASFILSSSTLAIITSVCFYITSRLSGFFIAMIKWPISYDQIDSFKTLIRFFGEKIIQFVTIFLPRFDIFSKSAWLTYGVSWENLNIILGQFIIYIAFILGMAMIDFNKKQF